MTFIAPKHRKEKIHKHGHMHLDDFVARQEQFQNELIVTAHFSVRYSRSQVERVVQELQGYCPDASSSGFRLFSDPE